ncbi:hypothetical protein FA13DRAFT_164225 [Coprinellus micaceus]|uniref:Uncharacterized protein n=1 Tax=Coprinellus micaceus TaxID=71717 RepID=A0A4Y7THJ2_COPMI|nr:hypothetical protein FA13DRAFT_164225 [Coprinellus micaceus]
MEVFYTLDLLCDKVFFSAPSRHFAPTALRTSPVTPELYEKDLTPVLAFSHGVFTGGIDTLLGLGPEIGTDIAWAVEVPTEFRIVVLTLALVDMSLLPSSTALLGVPERAFIASADSYLAPSSIRGRYVAISAVVE